MEPAEFEVTLTLEDGSVLSFDLVKFNLQPAMFTWDSGGRRMTDFVLRKIERADIVSVDINPLT